MRSLRGSCSGSEPKWSHAMRPIPTRARAATSALIRSRLTCAEVSDPLLRRDFGACAAPERTDEVGVPEVPRPRSLEERRIDVVRVLLVERGQKRPVHAGLEMMDGVVAVVEEQPVEDRRD